MADEHNFCECECGCQGDGRISIQCVIVKDSDLTFIQSEAELSEHYAPGTVVLVTEDEGMTYRKVIMPEKKELTGELTLNDLEAAISKFKHEHKREPNWLVVSLELEARGSFLCNVAATYHRVGADWVRHDIGLYVLSSLAPEQWFVTDDDPCRGTEDPQACRSLSKRIEKLEGMQEQLCITVRRLSDARLVAD